MVSFDKAYSTVWWLVWGGANNGYSAKCTVWAETGPFKLLVGQHQQ